MNINPYQPGYLFVYLLLMITLNAPAQDQAKVDSILQVIPDLNAKEQVQAYRQLFGIYFNHDLDIARIYATKSLQIAEQSGDLYSIAHGNNIMGVHLNTISEFDSALVFLEKAQSTFKKVGNIERQLAALNNIAVVYQNQGDVEKALSIQMDLLEIKEEQGIDGDPLATSYWNIGNLLATIYKSEKAIEWFQKAKTIYETSGDSAYVVDLDYQIAGELASRNNFSEAIPIFKNCEGYARKNKQPIALAGVLDWLGTIYIDLKEYQKAETYLSEALELALNNNQQTLPGQIYRRFSTLYLATNQINLAEKYAKLSLENAAQFDKKKKIITDYYILSEVYEKQGKHALALDFFKKFHIQNDSIFGLEKMNTINELQLKYEKQKKQQEIKALEEVAKRIRLERNSIIGGSIGLVVLFASLFYAMRQRMTSNRLAKEKLDQELLFSQKELDFKKQELTAYALQVASKNKFLEDIKSNVATIEVREGEKKQLQKIVNTININQQNKESWDDFRTRFQAIHKDFESNVKQKYPEVSNNELRLLALLKMNFSSKEMAHILNISPDGIKKARYRLRKKLGLETSESLEALVIGL